MTFRSRKLLDFAGKKFGRLTVLSFVSRTKGGTYWACCCECGKEKNIWAGHLKSGRIVSCGCWAADKARERTTHGMSKSRTYIAWRSMLNRCYWPKEQRFADYGGRGITVCERWRGSFESFLADLGAGPYGRTLERNDTNGNYEPGD